jgi:hypothetical protein
VLRQLDRLDQIPRGTHLFRTLLSVEAQDGLGIATAAQLEHAPHIGHAGEAELAFARFAQVPEQIEADRVEAHGFGLLEPGVPVFGQYPAEMHLSGYEQDRFAIDEKFSVARLEFMRPAFGHDGHHQ